MVVSARASHGANAKRVGLIRAGHGQRGCVRSIENSVIYRGICCGASSVDRHSLCVRDSQSTGSCIQQPHGQVGIYRGVQSYNLKLGTSL